MADKENMTPRPLNVPSNNPILAKQREHSTCIQPLTTLQYSKTRKHLKQPATNTDIPPPCGHTSEIRPLLPKLFRRRSHKTASGVSETMSTHSTSFEISRDASIDEISSPVPYVDLQVFISHDAIDYHKAADVWVCIEATVKAKTWLENDDVVIPSMRFCYKPIEGSDVVEFVGERSVKDLKAGQTCQLFLRCQLPKLQDPKRPDMTRWTQEELFEHLESMLGVHEMEFLQVEVKYRYPHIPSDNVMTVKHVCKIKRPRLESVWSMNNTITDIDQSVDVQHKLARLRATQQTNPYTQIKPPAKSLPTSPLPKPEVIISQVDAGTGNTARQLWNDLKRTSLSTSQLVEMSPERVEQLVASEPSLKARRQQALANKRSVGAETLKAWKWEEKVRGAEGEMPWL